MLKVNILAVGTLKEKYLKDACQEYEKRLGRFIKLSILEIPESSPNKEAEEMISRAKGKILLLDIEGREYTSVDFAARISELKNMNSELTFIIGGSEGTTEKIATFAHEKISFSKMTFPHQLFRVFLLEQLYRSETIQNGLTYHK